MPRKPKGPTAAQVREQFNLPPPIDLQQQETWVSWDKIKTRPVAHLWPGRIFDGELCVLEGRKGLGKSTLAAAIAAAVTGGKLLPDMPREAPRGVIWLTGEEEIGAVSQPRVLAMEGDPKRLLSPAIDPKTGSPRRLLFPGALDKLEAMVYDSQARLIVIDPLVSFLDANVNLMHSQSIRSVLEPLGSLCRRRQCAALVLRNLRKGTMGPAIDQGAGAGDVGNYARSVLRVDEDPDDKGRRILAVVAMNNGKPAGSLRYWLADAGHCARVEWLGACELTADELAEGLGDLGERDARADARSFLREFLSQGERKVQDIEAKADVAGVSRGTLRRAKRDLGVVSKPVGPNEDRYFVWILPSVPVSKN